MFLSVHYNFYIVNQKVYYKPVIHYQSDEVLTAV